jgi:hypothetical protein
MEDSYGRYHFGCRYDCAEHCDHRTGSYDAAEKVSRKAGGRDDEITFLQFAARLTGALVDQITVISFGADGNGLFSGLIEIDGNREYIHEYHS